MDSSGPSIRSEAERFLETHGFLTPPLPSRTWAWSRAIGGAGRGIGGAGQLASWTRAAQLVDVGLGGGSGGPGHGTPQAFNSAVDLPRARPGRRQRSIWPGRAVDQGGSARRRWPGRRQRWPGPRYPPGVQLCGGPAQGAPWAKAAVDRAWARRGPGRLSSRRWPGRGLPRGRRRATCRRKGDSDCWRGGDFWRATATATRDSRSAREPRSSSTSCAASRTPPPAWEA